METLPTISPSTNPVGAGTKNFSMNAPVQFFSLIEREAFGALVSSKQWIVEHLLKGVALDKPELANELREKLVAHRASAVRATREGASMLREASKVGLYLMVASYIIFNCFAGSTNAYRTSTAVRPVRRNSKSEEVA